MSSRRKAPASIRVTTALLLLGIFVAGIASGVGLTLWIGDGLDSGRPKGPPPRMLKRLPLERLSLSEEQWEGVHDIVEKFRPQLEEILEGTFPRVREVNEKIEQETRKLLTEEQNKKLDEELKNNPRRFHGPRWRDREGGRGGPGGHGPPPFMDGMGHPRGDFEPPPGPPPGSPAPPAPPQPQVQTDASPAI